MFFILFCCTTLNEYPAPGTGHEPSHLCSRGTFGRGTFESPKPNRIPRVNGQFCWTWKIQVDIYSEFFLCFFNRQTLPLELTNFFFSLTS